MTTPVKRLDQRPFYPALYPARPIREKEQSVCDTCQAGFRRSGQHRVIPSKVSGAQVSPGPPSRATMIVRQQIPPSIADVRLGRVLINPLL